jgi:hypothetical protein
LTKYNFKVILLLGYKYAIILLIGGDKTGNDRWYIEFVPIADALYDQHVEELKKKEK